MEPVGRLARDKARRRARQHDLDAAPRIDHAQPVAGMERRDGQAGARPDLEQTFPGQPLDRLAHRRAAKPEPLDQRAFGGDAAGRQFERDDHALQRAVGLRGRRLAGRIALTSIKHDLL